MARYYIDVDKAYDALNEKTKGKPPEYCGIAEEFIQVVDNLPAADVVPRSEVERLKVEGGILEQECGKLMGTVDSLEIELEAMRTAANSYKMHYDSLAREIFAEIENLSVNTVDDWGNSVQIIGEIDYAELKKKYTEK